MSNDIPCPNCYSTGMNYDNTHACSTCKGDRYILEVVQYHDTSTIKDIPDTAAYMGDCETLHMWAYPEPEYTTGAGGTMITLASWWIVTSLTGVFMSNMGSDLYMGSDQLTYTRHASYDVGTFDDDGNFVAK